MYIQLILLHFLLLRFLCISASSYGGYCTSDSDCDQHQKCLDNTCRCNTVERRFWTGEICAVCSAEFTVTYERCYKTYSDLKTWTDARAYCRSRYADLFTWRNNIDEQFIRPVIQTWVESDFFSNIWAVLNVPAPSHIYLSWAGATITSTNPYTTKWVDPAGLKLDIDSSEWCDPTVYAGYQSTKEPTSGTRKIGNVTEREQCVTYNFGQTSLSLLCLADDYCSQKYPYICEMNAASMKLANSALHGDDNNNNIDFEKPPPPPLPISTVTDALLPDTGIIAQDTTLPLALAENTGGLSMINIIIFLGIGILLIIGAIAGYIFLKKKKENSDDQISRIEEASPDRPGFTSSVEDMMDE